MLTIAGGILIAFFTLVILAGLMESGGGTSYKEEPVEPKPETNWWSRHSWFAISFFAPFLESFFIV